MPETRFARSVPRLLPQLDAFTQGYVTAALWTGNTENDPEGNGGDDFESADLDADDIDRDTLAAMVVQCADFQAANAADLAEHSNPHQAGVDFWLTRNGHGAGFWDRGLGALGDRLTAASHTYGECSLYLGDDGLIYCM